MYVDKKFIHNPIQYYPILKPESSFHNNYDQLSIDFYLILIMLHHF
jgi:hypothetical protein